MIDEDLNTPKNIGKGLLMCAFLASASMGMQQVQASGTDLSTPTLDALHNAGTTIPNSTTVYPESGYTLTETTDKTLDNVITKYEVKPVTRYYDMTTGAEVAPEARVAGTTYKEIQEKDLVPHYYQVNLKQTEYGAGVNSTTTTLTTQPVKDVEITSKYDTSQTRFDNTTDNSATNYSGDYINQTTNSQGGAIINNGTNAKLGNIKGNFIDNYASGSYHIFGGAIFNGSTISNITGNFIGNYASGSGGVYGGAMFNEGTMGNVIGEIMGNYVSSKDRYDNSTGGAIYNSGTIGNIIGAFIGNYVTSTSREAHGGAIANGYRSKIGNIAGDFIGNYALSTSSYALGGAINNDYNGTIGDITGDFIGNYAKSISREAHGGAIYNGNTISNITGDFIDNYVSSTSGVAKGGAIYNNDTIGNTTGNFIGNYATSTSSEAQGGAIYNTDNAILGDITGDFTSNYASGTTASGGAIYNKAIMNDINCNFDGNYISATSGEGSGGAIYNSNIIGDLNGQFTNNSVSSDNNAYGGAIYNNSNIGVQVANGKAITSYTIWKLSLVDANGKVLKSCYEDTSWRLDELKNNNKLLDELSFRDDTTTNEDEYNDSLSWGFIESTDDAIKAQFSPYMLENNLIDSSGIINTLFYNNSVKSTSGNANGGAIYNSGKIVGIKGDFIQNKATSESGIANGGAIYNDSGTIGDIDGNFTDNYATTNGGAIYLNGGTVNLKADNTTHYISGNKTSTEDNAVFGNTGSNLNMKATNGGKWIVNDNFNGVVGYNVNLQGDSTGTMNFNNKITNANLTNTDVTTNITSDNLNYNNSLTVNSGTVNVYNMGLNNVQFRDLQFAGGDTNLYGVNVDLANRQMGRFSSSTSSAGSGNLNVNSMDLLSDSDIPVTPVEFANGEFKNNVRSNVTTVEGKIFSYGVGYDKDSGDFIFTRGQGGVGGFTPATASQTVTNQVGAYSTLSNTMNYSFMHSNMFMDLPKSMRLTAITTNRYASLNSEGMEFDDVNRAVWVKPYTSFEKVPLHNGPTVENISYGTLVGGDSDFINLKHGWTGVISPFIGYNGAHQNYSNISSYQNGGTLGVTGYLYKGNFFSANTLLAGASAGESNSRYGKDDYTMLSAGFATRNGYNFEFKEGKYILQPSVTLGYMYSHTFDYMSANGARITDANLHVLQLNPTLKFIVNLHNKWQPYMQVGMVYNLMNECGVKANNVSLPSMTERSYVQYGVGVQKVFKDNFTEFGQAMIHNGGRNGISLTGGLKWALGKKKKKAKEKVENPTSEKTALRIQLPAKETATTAPVPQRKIIKQLTDSQRALLGAKAQNTTMTSNKGYFQEL